ncbi:outer membrane protein assembly factor BamA [uncultured Umboniibacter sp.]|uniref:outer membrane protein assembly factor BamA n=1 Tax=uncultured Umboniibacter sp. TaxID=1798917 RepID=UPI002627F48F|nr:outer membrane protein assembly factor BamA [uncultured Umboniibacter sp.]
MKRFARNLLAVALLPTAAMASEFRVSDIRLEGLQRLSAGTVFASLPINIGDTIDSSALRLAARSLFASGYYDDVRFEEDNGVLVVHVVERPAIDSIEIEGEKAIAEEDLLAGLSDSGLAEGQIFKRSVLDGITQELERQYISQGRYNATVEAEIVELARNRVQINIDIDEGSAASVRHINLVGNTLFTDEVLMEDFEMKESDWLSWMGSEDKYSREKLAGDIERLRSYYLDRGYLDFQIDSTQVTISDDNESIFVTLNMTEGEQYQIGETNIVGELVVNESELSRLVLIQPGMTFSQILMTTSADYMTQRLSNEGYTFAEVNGVPEVNEEGKVDITFFVQPGERTYVRRVEFRGNTKTADDVLRREMRQMEGSTASNIAIDQGKVRLERLGYFKGVEVATTEVAGTEDQVDVTYTVEEQPSGNVGGSVGYSDGYGLIFQANLQQNNFLGTGNAFGINLSSSKYYKSASLNYTDPYFTPDGVSRGFNVFYSQRDYGSSGFTPFGVDKYGAGVTLGWPISEIERISLGLTYNHSLITPGFSPAQQIQSTPGDINDSGYQYWAEQSDLLNDGGSFVDDPDNPILDDNGDPVLDDDGNPTFGQMYQDDPNDCYDLGTSSITGSSFIYYSCALNDISTVEDSQLTNNPPGFIDEYGEEYDDFTLRVTWMQSTLNRGILANRGYRQSLVFSATTPNSDLSYYKVNYEGQIFQPLTSFLTLRLHTRLGYGNGYGDLDELPFFENFYAGGLGSVRGYNRNVLGPRTSSAEYYAGQQVINSDGFGEGTLVNANGQLVTQLSGTSQRTNAFGGNFLVTAGAEFIFPTPFVKDQRSVQSSFFIDTGNVFSTSCENGELNCYDFDVSKLSGSYGLSLTWISGFGPLTFSYALPFNYDKSLEGSGYDFIERFQFSMGQAF